MDTLAKYKVLILVAFLPLASSLATLVQAHPNYEIIAGAGSTPTIDGTISSGEWDDASNVTFNETTVFVKQDGVNLYIAFNVTDATYSDYDECGIAFDVDHDRSATLQTDDIWFTVMRNGTIYELNETTGWTPYFQVSGWTADANSTGNVWQSEFNISYSKLNIATGTNKTIGVFFVSLDTQVGPYHWPPPPANPYSPASWGAMTPNGYNWIPEFSNMYIYVILFSASPLICLLIKRGMSRKTPLSSTA